MELVELNDVMMMMVNDESNLLRRPWPFMFKCLIEALMDFDQFHRCKYSMFLDHRLETRPRPCQQDRSDSFQAMISRGSCFEPSLSWEKDWCFGEDLYSREVTGGLGDPGAILVRCHNSFTGPVTNPDPEGHMLPK